MIAAPPPPVANAVASAAPQIDTLVAGCRDGEPAVYARLPGQPDFTAEQRAQARAELWRTRGSASGLCLAFAAHQLAADEPEHARTLAAVGFVRARWEAVRCAGPAPDGQGYRSALGVAEAGVELQAPGIHAPASAWRAAVRLAAEDPATYAYTLDMAKVCDPAAVRPEAEWSTLQEKLKARIAAAANKP